MPGADSNFSVIKEAKLEFARIMVLIGPQACGKSLLLKLVAHRKVVDMIVELEGSDVSKAIQQIRTIEPIRARCQCAGEKHAALVMCSNGVHINSQRALKVGKGSSGRYFN